MNHIHLILLIFGLAHAFAPQDSMSCETDADCFPEENGVFACKDGLCALAPGRCTHEKDCSRGHYCESNHCKRECDSDKDCHLEYVRPCLIPKCLYPQNPDEPVGCQLALKEDTECELNEYKHLICRPPFSCENCKCVLLDPENYEYSFLGITRTSGDHWADYFLFNPGSILRIQVKKLKDGKEEVIMIDYNQNTTCIKDWKYGDAIQIIKSSNVELVWNDDGTRLFHSRDLLHRKSGQKLNVYAE